MSDKLSVEKLTRVFLKIRSRRDELRREYEDQDSKLVEQQDKIKRYLLDYCKENEVDSVKTASGTFYRSVRTKYWTNDWESMYKFIMENNVPEFFQKSLNQSNVREFLEENPDIAPPGLNVDSEYVLSVRKPRATK